LGGGGNGELRGEVFNRIKLVMGPRRGYLMGGAGGATLLDGGALNSFTEIVRRNVERFPGRNSNTRRSPPVSWVAGRVYIKFAHRRSLDPVRDVTSLLT